MERSAHSFETVAPSTATVLLYIVMNQTLRIQRKQRIGLLKALRYLIPLVKNGHLLCTLSGLLSIQLSQAQAPTVTGLNPSRNLRNASASTNVELTFSQSISSSITTLNAMRVYSAQRGGQMRSGARGTTTVNGNTITFDPTTNFRAGETVFTTITSAAQSDQGVNLARGHVFQFTVGTGGTGRGYFIPPSTNPNPGVGFSPYHVAVGDVDGDGDLDFVTANFGNGTASVRLNNGSGNFTAPTTNPNPAVGSSPYYVALGDVDSDGDLDLLVANQGASTVSLRINDGTGNFTPPAIAQPKRGRSCR
ncbi:hypothetical protein GCM10027592_37590 [Spirosoma flavus]